MKPCPYCDSGTRIHSRKIKPKRGIGETIQTAQIKCKRMSCGMSGPLFKGENARRQAQSHWDACMFSPSMLPPTNPT